MTDYNNNASPAYKLATNRSMWKMLLLGILTLGIYPTIIYYYMYEDINIIASRHDGKRTMHPVAMSFLCVITLGIYYFVWMHKLCKRIGNELDRRSIDYRFSAKHFWLLDVLCGCVLYIPFIPMFFNLIRNNTFDFQMLSYQYSYQSSYDFNYNANEIMQGIPQYALILFGVAAAISVVCHLIFVHKYCKAMNHLAKDYNQRG